ncbi:SDR family NAD(P)-dependent oxidoreductase [Prosthecodimorpha staleyi]|uniref:SDR family oxidoreductase n=1 Tax=Prosthecodimorpha staleyi TaxID=2840188 RepID=A0A947DAH5_9HYPH|nr:SDR family NAD(P)-dependent oxidoreductase [Prosthecodimorpha staleyi]MBT9291547.1 SDR family oxidoreductase [Prosthecodimorpha staleyi]
MGKGRTALVTGGCGGIGAAICRRLADDGFTVAVVDRDAGAAVGLATALPGTGHVGIGADVAEEMAVEAAFAAAEAALGPIDVLVTAAGILMLRPDGNRNAVAETPLDEWQRTQEVNATGTFLFCRAYARRVTEPRRGARVVTVSSVAAQLGGYRSSSAYIASKSAVIGLTKGLARELAPYGVTANSVAPGLIDAPMLRLSLDPADDARAAAGIPLGRLGTPGDVAGAVAFLVSADAAYVTGCTIDVNGGYRMQ